MLAKSTSLSSATAGRRVVHLPCRTVGTNMQAHSGFSRRKVVAMARGGGGVMDKPITTPGKEKGTESVGKKPPIYKVMLHNDNYNRREYVVKVLMKVVDSITVDDAVNVMQEAHISGVALVVACAQDEAEGYCEALRLNGLVASLEPGR